MDDSLIELVHARPHVTNKLLAAALDLDVSRWTIMRRV